MQIRNCLIKVITYRVKVKMIQMNSMQVRKIKKINKDMRYKGIS